METVLSKDSTPIAYGRTGMGAPVVLVHGTTHDQYNWAPVLPALERKHRVHVMDRRGAVTAVMPPPMRSPVKRRTSPRSSTPSVASWTSWGIPSEDCARWRPRA
jgi:pimeloyl-ACP methyl ester carboxylesterase